MKIHKIEIENFKGFLKNSFNFTERFTVIIGNNGKGKTSLIDALAIAASAYLLGIDELGAADRKDLRQNMSHCIDFDRYFAAQYPVVIRAEGELETALSWQQTLSTAKSRSPRKIIPISDIAKQHQESIRNGIRVELPVFAYYSTERLPKEQKIEPQSKGSIFEAYATCLNPANNNIDYLEWLHTYEYMVEIHKENDTLLNLVKQAISDCMDNWHEIYFDLKENDLVGTRYFNNGIKQRIPFKHLSDGQRTIAALVAELAYRCVILNGHLQEKAIKNAKGLVLIDELDQHLHPQWQKRIVEDLKQTFPNLQFVATTHSPFIIQSLKKTEVINLDELDGIDSDFFKQSIEDIAEYEMGVENVQRSEKFLAMEESASKYFALIRNRADKASLEQAKKKLDELHVLFSDDPAYVALLKAEFPR
jgi:predicted ATP-binding protein involved in virulence